MSSNSNNLGRAYEYAWIISLHKIISLKCNAKIVKNSSFDANKRAWDTITEKTKNMFLASIITSAKKILELEPRILEKGMGDIELSFQKDEEGAKGDVRDIILKRDSICWEIGLSIKHNHEAVKHSRLSYKLDFGKEWFNIPCSEEYWKTIKPVFDMLQKEKLRKTKWSEIKNKDTKVYIPLLQAFVDEIKRSYKKDSHLPQKMVEYLVGTKDYYKVVSEDKKELTIIYTYNLNKNLNASSKTRKPLDTVPPVILPTKLIDIGFKKNSKNTVEMYLDEGWQLSFRIHSASTFVEPSLKFDVQFINMPNSIMHFECKWKDIKQNEKNIPTSKKPLLKEQNLSEEYER